MPLTIDPQLAQLQEDARSVAKTLAEIAETLGKVDEMPGRRAMLLVGEELVRVVRAARTVRNACPRCNRPDAKLEFESVNRL